MVGEINLGKTEIKITRIGIGVMQWGSIKASQANGSQDIRSVLDMYETSCSNGVNFFDTAEVYGNGVSEKNLGNCLRHSSNKVVVASKFMPYPWRVNKRELRSALMRSLERLGLDHIDLYQMHWPLPPVSIPGWMEAMAEVVREGLVKAVGVSNYSPSQTQQAYDSLAQYHIPLASNQVKFSLLDQKPIASGLVELCNQLGVTIIAYSPLEKGILTGKYTTERLPRGLLSWRYNKSVIMKITTLIKTLQEISAEHGGSTPGQVALNWLSNKGAVPIPGARTVQQAQDNSGAMKWSLDTDEAIRLDEACQAVQQSGYQIYS
jgi:aryl-alcohol dehydrogenase-like predicted oxidoreductase